MAIKVLVVDDHTILREGIRSIFKEYSHIEVVGEADNGKTAVEMCSLLKPNIVLIGITMSQMNGIDATIEIKSICPDINIICLSMHNRKDFVVEMLKAGVSGYVLKSDSFSDILSAINTVTGGSVYLSPKVTELIREEIIYCNIGNGSPARNALAERERQVLQMIADGKSTKQIAMILDLSIKTVEVTRRRIKDKLGIDSIAGLTKYAIKTGLTGLEIID